MVNKDKLETILGEVDILVAELANKAISGSVEQITINNLADFRQALLAARTSSDVRIANSILINFIVGSFDYDSDIYKRLDEITEETARIVNNENSAE